jgi:hypothetical protein
MNVGWLNSCTGHAAVCLASQRACPRPCQCPCLCPCPCSHHAHGRRGPAVLQFRPNATWQNTKRTPKPHRFVVFSQSQKACPCSWPCPCPCPDHAHGHRGPLARQYYYNAKMQITQRAPKPHQLGFSFRNPRERVRVGVRVRVRVSLCVRVRVRVSIMLKVMPLLRCLESPKATPKCIPFS